MECWYAKYNVGYFEDMHSFINVSNGHNKIYEIDESDKTLKMCLHMFHNDPKFYKYSKKQLSKKLTKNGENIFLFAAACGKLNIIKYLESLGFDINYKNKFGHNAYIYASYFGKIDVLQYLEKKNIKNDSDDNIIVLSVIGGHLEVLKYLQNKYFNIYRSYDFILNPYIIAVCFKHIHIVAWLEEIEWNKYVYKYMLYEDKYLYVNACRISESSGDMYCWTEKNWFYEHYAKQHYNGYEPICKICYEHTNDFMINCKNNHPVHYICQKKEEFNYKCLLCTAPVLI